MKYIVDKQEIRLYSNSIPIVTDSYNFVKLDFEFSTDWDGLTKTAQITQNGDTYNLKISDQNRADFPSEITSGEFEISVFGVTTDGTTRATTIPCKQYVKVSGYKTDGHDPINPTPSIYQQWVTIVSDKIEEVERLAEIINGQETEILHQVDLSYEYSTLAKESEDKSKQSENNAKLSEDNAKLSENNAKLSETNAKASENSASTSAATAKTHEDNASGFADDAEESASQASGSATLAKTSENNAKTSETNAKTSEVNSKKSEDNAKVSETNAKTSEDNAKASETEVLQRLQEVAGQEMSYRKISLISDGEMLYLRKDNPVFNSVQHFIAPSTYVDDTTIVSTDYAVTGDVLNVVNDFLYLGKDTTFDAVFFNFGTIMSSGTNRTYEYLATDNVWKSLTLTLDGTSQWQKDGVITFDTPSDWIKGSVNSVSDLFWIRVGTVSGTFSTEPTLILCLPISELPENPVEVFALNNDTVPSFVIDSNGGVAIGYIDSSTYRLRVNGATYLTSLTLGGAISGATSIASTGAVTISPATTGQSHVGAFIASAPAASSILPSNNSPVARFSGQAWNGVVAKTNTMEIYVNPDSDPVTKARMAFKNTTINGFSDASELMNLSSDGHLTVLGKAQPLNELFDCAQYYVSGAYYDCTTLVGVNDDEYTGDVLNVVGDYFYLGKKNKFASIYFAFSTIMSAGTTRTWEYFDGTAWKALPITSDGTVNWSKDGLTTFTPPVDWNVNTVNSIPNLYWVRIGTLSGTFSTEPTLHYCAINATTLDREILKSGNFDTSADWEVSGDWSYTTGDYTFTFAGGFGTLKQLASNFKNPVKPNTWYRFRYYVGVAAPSTTVCWIGNEIADGNVFFSGSTTEVDVFFKTNSDPKDFVIYASATATSGFCLNGVSLQEMRDGDITATGKIKGAGFVASDGTEGMTGTQKFKDDNGITKTMIIKNGLIVSIV